MPGYRSLTVKLQKSWRDKVTGQDKTTLAFTGSDISFDIPDEWLIGKGVDPANLVPGTVVYLKGKEGNDDVQLWGINRLDDLRLAP